MPNSIYSTKANNIRNTLFRQAAIDHQRPSLQGRILLLPSPTSWMLLSGCAAIVAMAISWLSFAEYTRKAGVSGILAPTAGEVKVFSPTNGTLLEQRITEGQTVQKGDVLFVFSGERHTDHGQGTLAQSITSFIERRMRLEQEIVQAEQMYRTQQAHLHRRLSELIAEQRTLDDEMSLGQQRVTLAEHTLAKFQQLQHAGFVSTLQVQQKHEEIIDLRSRLANTERQRRHLEREKLSLNNEVKTLPPRHATQISQLRRELAALQQTQLDIEGRRRFVVTAPSDGVVAAVNRMAGQYADPSLPLATLLPTGSQLEALVYAPSHAIGFIQPGKPVWLRYHSFPYQKFGQQPGHVIDVTHAAVDPQAIGLPAREPLYRIRIKLDQQGLMAYGRWHALRPGMRLDASVDLERRRLIEWLFEPLISVGRRI